MTETATVAPEQTPTDTLLDGIEEILQTQLACHQRLLTLVEAKREAVRCADIRAIGNLCRDENPLLQRVTDLEKRRLTLVGAVTEIVDPQRSTPLTLAEMANLAGVSQRSRLEVLGVQVREAIQRMQRESSIVRAAAEKLSAHMAGVMQVVQSALSQARVYGRQGQLDPGAPVISTLDLKS